MLYKTSFTALFLTSLMLCSDWRFQSDGPLSIKTQDNQTVREYSDNVIIKNDRMTLYTDRAMQYTDSNEILLEGNVKMVTDSDILECDKMYYWSVVDSAIASGSVLLSNKQQKIISDKITYKVMDGPFGFSFVSNGHTIIKDSLRTLSGNYISYNDKTQTMNIRDSANVIEINKGIAGDHMKILFKDKDIRTIIVDGYSNAFQNMNYTINNRQTKLKNQMHGDTIIANINDNNIETLRISGMAITEYHVFDTTKLIGRNIASGGAIKLKFREGNLNQIEVFGGGRGKFIPNDNNKSIDSTILYKAEYIDHLIDVQKTHLIGDSDIQYKGTSLKSESIFLNWETNTLLASELKNKIPVVYTRGNAPLQGKSIEFNMVTNKGKLRGGRTEVNDSFFHGKDMYKGEGDSYHVFKGKYTSCDLDRPHFHLSSQHMKMLQNDKIIARPVILFIQDIPVFYLPFAIIPNRQGQRKSGWVMPQIGESGAFGYFIKNLGYYWAPNDYMDYRILMNLYDRDGITINTLLRYKKIYKYSGSITTSLTQNLRSSSDILDILNNYTRLWSLKWNHYQEENDFGKLIANYNYVSSSSYYQDSNVAIDPEVRLNQQIISNISYSKKISDKTKISANIKENYFLLIEQQTIQETGLNISPTYKQHHSSIILNHNYTRGSTAINLNSVYRGNNYISNYSNNGSEWTSKENLYRDGINHFIKLSTSRTVLGWLNISPQITISENWITNFLMPSRDEDGNFNEIDGLDIPESTQSLAYFLDGTLQNEESFKRRTTVYGSMEANTKFFGTFPINIGKLKAIRHTIRPKVSFNYRPEKVFGDYIIKDSSGDEFDVFEYSQFRGARTTSNNKYQLSINNLIETKTIDDDGQYNKSQLLSWNLATSYDRDLDSLNFSSISSSIQTSLFDILNLSIKTNHDIYSTALQDDLEDGTKRYSYENAFIIPKLKYISLNTSIVRKGKSVAQDFQNWSGRFTIRYTNHKRTRLNDNIEEYYWDPTISIDNSIKINITEQWKLSYRSRIDLLDNTLLNQSFIITRDLHCWEFGFSWWPGGFNQGFLLSIKVKNPDLQDIKLRSSGGSMLKL